MYPQYRNIAHHEQKVAYIMLFCKDLSEILLQEFAVERSWDYVQESVEAVKKSATNLSYDVSYIGKNILKWKEWGHEEIPTW